MAIRRFRKNDADYKAWLERHPTGFVVNIDESEPAGTRLHRASCVTLRGPIERGQDLTGPYPKVCSDDLEELRRESGNPRPCGFCDP